MSDRTKPSYFVTTPIYYVNADPHLGTAYSTIIADVQARFRRADGYNVKFLTGMDEHGEKVAEAAAKHGMTPQEWTDSQAPHFKQLWETLEISNDDFIRTTEPRQYKAVQYLWERMKESGYLYKGSYDGWYCVPDETYFTETQVEKGDEENGTPGAHLCPDCHRPLERVKEESYFFKLSAFQDKLLKLYDEHPDFVQPDFRMNEVRSFVEGGLNDLSVSRTSFDWGIPVPFDEGHVTYVWFDALLNYMTACGYGVDSDEARAPSWPTAGPPTCTSLVRTSSASTASSGRPCSWPSTRPCPSTSLPTASSPCATPRRVGREDVQGRGNAIAPQDVIDLLGVEGYRYYFMTDVTPGTDGAISFERMEQVYNADLANSWGNLISRSANISVKYFDGCAPAKPTNDHAFSNPLADVAEGIHDRYAAKMGALDYAGAKDEAMALIHAANHYIEELEPWALAKDGSRADELAFVIYNLLEAIRIAAHLLMPFMPTTSAEALRRISCRTRPRPTTSRPPASGAALPAAPPSRRATRCSRAWSRGPSVHAHSQHRGRPWAAAFVWPRPARDVRETLPRDRGADPHGKGTAWLPLLSQTQLPRARCWSTLGSPPSTTWPELPGRRPRDRPHPRPGAPLRGHARG